MSFDNKIFPRPGIEIRLADKDSKAGTQRVQLARTGSYYHAWYGPFELNAAMFLAFVANFKAKTYGIDLMIDYDHDRCEAAAWFKDLYLSEDQTELWAEVSWTPQGQKDVEEKNYRYMSIDFSTNHVDSEQGAEHGPVLYGAALTNRPFIKGMTPTTELNDFHGGKMNLEELKKENKTLSERLEQLGKDNIAAVKALTDKLDQAVADQKKLADENAKLLADAAVAKKEGEFSKLLADKKAVPAQKEAYMAGDMTKFAELAGKLNDTPAGHGTAGEGGNTEGSGEESEDDKVLKLAEEKFAKGGRTMGDCISEAKKELKSK